MTNNVIYSAYGVPFSTTSVESLHRYLIEFANKEKCFLYLAGATDDQGNMDVIIAADYVVRPSEILDQLGPTVFYWQIKQSNLENLRQKYCLDIKWGRNVCLIPLAEMSS